MEPESSLVPVPIKRNNNYHSVDIKRNNNYYSVDIIIYYVYSVCIKVIVTVLVGLWPDTVQTRGGEC